MFWSLNIDSVSPILSVLILSPPPHTSKFFVSVLLVKKLNRYSQLYKTVKFTTTKSFPSYSISFKLLVTGFRCTELCSYPIMLFYSRVWTRLVLRSLRNMTSSIVTYCTGDVSSDDSRNQSHSNLKFKLSTFHGWISQGCEWWFSSI